jgi:hypothetical protein
MDSPPNDLLIKICVSFQKKVPLRINQLGLDVAVVFRFRNSIRIDARLTLVATCRGLQLERLVPAFLVELLADEEREQ